MRGSKLSWFYLIFLLSFIIGNLGAIHDVQKKNPSAAVVGTVYCDTCFQDDFSKSIHFISGASVAVECKEAGTSIPSFRQEVKTDEHGEFKVHLPFSVSKHVKKIKRCSVKLISSSKPYCAVASTATSSSLHLKERKQGMHIFSAGFFTFKPLKQPNLCNQKPSLENAEELNSKKTSVPPLNDTSIFPTPLQDPPTPDPPLLPLLPKLPPVPQLPSLPPLPGLANLPPMPGTIPDKKPEQVSRVTKLSEQKASSPEFFFPASPFPPNPFLRPPLFPPNPFQPPSVFPPNPFQPSPLLPPNPLLPPPLLPPNPLLPPPLLPPNPLRPPPLLPPNPLQPPPLLPPNPLQPPPLLPPIPLIPPPSPLIPFPPVPLIPFPPIPGLTPPPPPPSFPFPLPPFPFPLPPFPPPIPGIPPASTSPKKPSP